MVAAAPIDYQLTLAQLDEVAEAVPRVRTTSAFVDTYISKLHPAEGVNVRFLFACFCCGGRPGLTRVSKGR